ncbi:response regulator transcription factor [Streptomyces sp. ME02-8801-2C]|uniref:response regulator transcription factor n=1 Tax=Streptomyces sp. ME02-8801-2C TaxID=3028680 RepID=UPI0029B6F9EE|nr:response regulator transcription factor [Streptomyces sp. ME02-8801-2C]MDX3453253.1 response regulator transcription factor [Streptomyces sp. ME02-8801-2C]
MGVRVLLIEDDETIAEPLAEGLRNFGLTVAHVATGAEGLRGPHGDVVLLDLGLPDIDGIDVCRGIRQTSEVPIIILSARGEEADRVLGLELGADDYLAKPFSMRELVARIRAVTRRTRRPDPYVTAAQASPPPQEPAFAYEAPAYEAYEAPVYAAQPPSPAAPAFRPPPPSPSPSPSPSFEAYESFDSYASHASHAPPSPRSSQSAAPAPEETPTPAPGPLVVDRRTRQVWVGDVAVALTPKEFELLALLSEDPGAVYSRRQILTHVWDTHYQGPTKTLDVHVATLRRKLGNPAWIQTLRGVGFRLAVRTPGGPRAAAS